MRMFKAVLLLIVMSLTAMAVEAETLYKWIDRNGVPKFSNQPPPPDVETFETIEGVREPASDQGERSSYRRMMNQVEAENHSSQALRKQKANQRAQEEKRKAEAEREERISAERQRLEQQIDEINNRALGPYFTEGMRRAQIEEIQKEIEDLEKDDR